MPSSSGIARCLRGAAPLAAMVLLSITALPALGQPAEPVTGVVRQIGTPAGAPRVGAELETITEAVSAKLRCPVCQGMSVSDSPSESARAMKDEIRELLSQGYSADQVNAYFESTYGEFVLLDPKPEGLNWLLLLAPGTIFVGGLVGITVALRRRRDGADLTRTDPSLDPYLERVRGQLTGDATTEPETH